VTEGLQNCPIPSGGAATAAGAPHGPDARPLEHDATPRASHEDVMRRARELRERQRATAAIFGEEHRG
jgi:hypothetical protein